MITKILERMRDDPFYFIEMMWGLTPQKKGDVFIRGKHLSWQQTLIIEAYAKAINDEASKRIAISSGHGIGKTTASSLIILHFLFTRVHSQIACTSPSSDQLYDVLWKELSLWIQRIKNEDIKKLFIWEKNHVRMADNPSVWFARAKTARKEKPEALAGVHSKHVLLLADEGSGVDESIYRTAEGALTDKNSIVIIFSNPTRITGYFYDAFHSDKDNWQLYQFSSIDSPVVKDGYVQRMADKHGEDSDEFRIRVLGQFPMEDSVDDKGYVPLLNASDLRYTNDPELIGRKKMGIDPAGEGDDESVHVVRDSFKAVIKSVEKKSTPMTVAQRAMTISDDEDVKADDIFCDNFGEGANVALEIAYSTGAKIKGVNVGKTDTDEAMFLNKRAECYWRLREWVMKGGLLYGDADTWKELLSIRYRRNLQGKLQIMSKDEMRKLGIRSPNKSDALSLTFWDRENKASLTGNSAVKKYVRDSRARSIQSLTGF